MTEEQPQRWWNTDPRGQVAIDGPLLRALAHPMRNRIVSELRRSGPATATMLAERLGVNTGATSYHLRQLAEAGLIEDDADRGNARDRWWKASHGGTYFDQAELVEQDPALAGAFLHSVAAGHSEAVSHAIDAMPGWTKAWIDASDLSDFTMFLNPRQVKQMREEIYDILDKYSSGRDDPHARGAKRVSVQLNIFRSDEQTSSDER